MEQRYIPPVSPYNLIQEVLWPDEWKCLVACLMLNCTSRRQVEKIIPTFFSLWPDPYSFLNAKQPEITNVICTLGFQNRRSKRLLDMTEAYIKKDWRHVSQLPGVGEYASRAWEIFFTKDLGGVPPTDGALMLYWNWRKKHDN